MNGCRSFRLRRGAWRNDGCGLRGRDAFDHCFLPWLFRLFHPRRDRIDFGGLLDHLE